MTIIMTWKSVSSLLELFRLHSSQQINGDPFIHLIVLPDQGILEGGKYFLCPTIYSINGVCVCMCVYIHI